MSSILVIDDIEAVNAALSKLGLKAVDAAQAFRAFAGAASQQLTPAELQHHIDLALNAHLAPRPAPKFGGDRPYLKRKKGRS